MFVTILQVFIGEGVRAIQSPIQNANHIKVFALEMIAVLVSRLQVANCIVSLYRFGFEIRADGYDRQQLKLMCLSVPTEQHIDIVLYDTIYILLTLDIKN